MLYSIKNQKKRLENIYFVSNLRAQSGDNLAQLCNLQMTIN